MVRAAKELDVAIGQPARQVAGPVEARARLAAEWVWDEPIRRQVGPIQVAAGQTVAADVNLADHANRHGLAVGVQNMDFGVGDGPPDGGRRAGLASGAGRVNCRLRRSVKIIDFLDRAGGAELVHHRGLQRLTSQVHHARRRRERMEPNQLDRRRRHRVNQRHVCFGGQIRQLERVPGDDHLAAAAQGREELEHGEVKAN